MADDSKNSKHRDYGFFAIIVLVVINAIWLLLMPLVPAIASATLHRFHLRTSSFALWAIQQPIPSMYNFANRYEVSEIPPDFVSPGFLDPVIPTDKKRYINHFPTRVLTFANTRARHLADGKDRWVSIDSTYRGQTLESQYHARPRESGGYDILLVSGEDEP